MGLRSCKCCVNFIVFMMLPKLSRVDKWWLRTLGKILKNYQNLKSSTRAGTLCIYADIKMAADWRWTKGVFKVDGNSHFWQLFAYWHPSCSRYYIISILMQDFSLKSIQVIANKTGKSLNWTRFNWIRKAFFRRPVLKRKSEWLQLKA